MKTFVLFVLLFGFVGVVKGQVLFFDGGVTNSNQNWLLANNDTYFNKPYADFTINRPGIFLGIGAEFLTEKMFSISPGIYYYQTGTERSQDQIREYNSRNYRKSDLSLPASFNYLSIDGLLNFNSYTTNRKIKLQLQVGPRLDYLISNNLNQIDLGPDANPYNFPEGNSKEINSVNYGVTSGIGLYYMVNNLQFGIKSYYFWRVKDIVNKHIDYSYISPGTWTVISYRLEIKEQPWVIGMSVGYRLSK